MLNTGTNVNCVIVQKNQHLPIAVLRPLYSLLSEEFLNNFFYQIASVITLCKGFFKCRMAEYLKINLKPLQVSLHVFHVLCSK